MPEDKSRVSVLRKSGSYLHHAMTSGLPTSSYAVLLKEVRDGVVSYLTQHF
jgi:hypothetical protein